LEGSLHRAVYLRRCAAEAAAGLNQAARGSAFPVTIAHRVRPMRILDASRLGWGAGLETPKGRSRLSIGFGRPPRTDAVGTGWQDCTFRADIAPVERDVPVARRVQARMECAPGPHPIDVHLDGQSCAGKAVGFTVTRHAMDRAPSGRPTANPKTTAS
jgi:hypothetical protein